MLFRSSAFSEDLINATSLFKTSGKNYSVIPMAAELHQKIVVAFNEFNESASQSIMNEYNAHLYKLNQEVNLQKENQIISTTIKGVNDEGFLITSSTEYKQIRHGEVEWIWD